MSKKLSTVGIVMPKDFEATAYESVHARINANQNTESDTWQQYAGAWNAVAYRFLSVTESDKMFTKSIKRYGDAPKQPERYYQERELFSFFVNGLATIESLCYGLFAIGSMLNPQEFPTNTAKDLRLISPERTAGQFAKAFQGEGITFALQHLIATQEFRDWKEIRNVLAHRTSPGRLIYGLWGSLLRLPCGK